LVSGLYQKHAASGSAEFNRECDTGDATADDAGIEGVCRKIWAMLSHID
jgi:hypothetical protein